MKKSKPNFQAKLLFLLSMLGFLVFVGCGQVNPYTERSQNIFISESKEIELAQNAWKEFFDNPKIVVSQDPKELMPFQRVFEKMVEAAKKSKFSE